MCFKDAKNDRSVAARRRLAERPVEKPRHQTTQPRGNAPVDKRDLQRGLERLEALVGR